MYQRTAQPLRLKDWLIQQIDSGQYPGLCWENAEKTVFKIPWKHAAKQNYSEEEDAALFKAWAVYKGKFREGTTKAEPSAWKTRLRCALNKSPDFQEVPESCQDAGEPYKIYRIVSEPQERSNDENKTMSRSPYQERSPSPLEERPLQIVESDSLSDEEPLPKLQRVESEQSSSDTDCPASPALPTDLHNYHKVRAGEKTPETDAIFSPSSCSDFWLHIRLYYQGKLVSEVTTQTAEGCRIALPPSSQTEYSPCPPFLLEEIPFPSPQKLMGVFPLEVQQVLKKLLKHLDKGVVLWVAPEGVFVKRQCQVRVYWNGPLATHKDQPNKLEREKTCKVLDTVQFMHEWEMYLTSKGPEPQYQIQLCFGEEYPETSGNTSKLITAHVEPVFARELVEKAKMKLIQVTNIN
ncbi:interferon regulatory factor 4-like isoform X2 [Hyperolius riggenbachi]